MAALPETRYARSSDATQIAYQVFGDGPTNVVFVTGFVGNVEAIWEEPMFAHFFHRLARFCRLAIFDKRGQGLSDRPPGAPTLEQTMDDARAVMDGAGWSSATLLGLSEGGPATLLFAASYPERVDALVLYGTYARIVKDEGCDCGFPVEMMDAFANLVDEQWGGPVAADLFAPTLAADPGFRASWARFLRHGASPASAKAYLTMYKEIDARHVLPAITAPTLILHRRDDRLVPLCGGRNLADHIEHARLVELDGADHLYPVNGDQIVDEVEEFLTGARHVQEVDRVLATVMFTDIVDSTAQAATLGDRGWRQLVERHDELVRRELQRHRGRPIKTLGDGFLATFDGPARAVRCAETIASGVRELGIEIRAGLHTGELELAGDDVAGMAVNIGARVASLAGPGEVLVSSTVKDLVFGSGIDFSERGEHQLKGVPGEWRLFAACA